MYQSFLCIAVLEQRQLVSQCTDPVPEKKKKINATVPVKFETRQLSIQHVLLVTVRTTRQMWRNLGVLSSAVGVTRDFCA